VTKEGGQRRKNNNCEKNSRIKRGRGILDKIKDLLSASNQVNVLPPGNDFVAGKDFFHQFIVVHFPFINR
jgi:hypothetical protein